ncbi:tyrosine-type recombinase/integrase [Aquirhabdus parva]|uniref:DUF4102 domain-containing protein n=1 Tax=Aquirhabdus parva TaxID=2283318 RepID=A0A345P7K4_9GAMM|nr:integrase arm-type DNA-binding domain-containing protein [Aquirhabdus parva]AXI03263.1 DUF4102 domain-containing protein [Aquirhabdus parva]
MPKLVVPLTDPQIKKAKYDSTGSNKLRDGGGLFLLLDKNGSKYWHMDYTRPVTKKRNTLAFGIYPYTTLAKARELRDSARKLIAQGLDPSDQKKQDAAEAQISLNNSFEAIALEWLERQQIADVTKNKALYLLKFAFAGFGKKPIRDVLPIDVLKVCRAAEAEGHLEKAHRIKSKCSQVFRYAIASTILETDPTRDLRGALKSVEVTHHAAIIDPLQVGQLLKAIDNYSGQLVTIAALKLAPLTFVRPGELRAAKWADINLEKGLWSYTPPKTKKQTKVELIVPLSTQALSILKDMHLLSTNSEYVFPSLYTNLRCMSEGTINQALRRMGYGKDEMCGHGFRAMARTILEEVLEYPIEIIEQQLGHQVRDMHGRAYNRTRHLDKRKDMMQAWANYLDSIKSI